MSLGTLFNKCSDRLLARLLKAAGLQRHLFSFNLLGSGSTSQHVQLIGPAWRCPEYSRTPESTGFGLSFLLHRLWISSSVSMLSFHIKRVRFCGSSGQCAAVMMSLTCRLITGVTLPTTRQTFYFLQTILSKQTTRLRVPLLIWNISSCFLVLPVQPDLSSPEALIIFQNMLNSSI